MKKRGTALLCRRIVFRHNMLVFVHGSRNN